MAIFKQKLRNSQYQIVLEMTQGSQNIANNTSQVRYNAYIEKLSGSGYASGFTHPYNVKINGSTVKSGSFGGYNFARYSTLSLGSGTVTVSHASNGTKTVSGSAYFEANQSGAIGTGNVSGSLALDRIPRHSTISVPGSFTLGNAFTITLNRQDPSFWHYVDIKHGSEMMWTSRVDTSASVTIDRNKMLDRVPNANSATLTLVYTTRAANGTELGRSTRNITCNLNAPSPTIGGISHSDNNSAQFTHFGSYVQSKSRLKIAMTGVSPGRGARITSYRMTVDGQVLNAASGTTQAISRSGTVPIVANVTDSRGKTASRTVNISVAAYSPPAITSLKAFRCNSSGVKDDYGTYAKFEIGYKVTPVNNKNTKSVKAKVGGYDNWRPQTNYSGTHVEILSGFGVNSKYNYTVYVADYFGSTVSTGVIPTGAVTMLWGRDSMAVGTSELMESGSLNIQGQGYQNGRKIVDFNTMPDWRGVIDFNEYWQHGVYVFSSSADVHNSANKPPSANAGRLMVYTLGDYSNTPANTPWRYSWQVFQDLGGKTYSRHMNTGAGGKPSWSHWKTFLDTDNTTDYVVEYGSNYTRWNSGKQECWGKYLDDTPITTAIGAMFRRTGPSINFPKPFTDVPVLTATTGNYATTAVGKVTNTYFYLQHLSPDKNRRMDGTSWYAIGKWK